MEQMLTDQALGVGRIHRFRSYFNASGLPRSGFFKLLMSGIIWASV